MPRLSTFNHKRVLPLPLNPVRPSPYPGAPPSMGPRHSRHHGEGVPDSNLLAYPGLPRPRTSTLTSRALTWTIFFSNSTTPCPCGNMTEWTCRASTRYTEFAIFSIIYQCQAVLIGLYDKHKTQVSVVSIQHRTIPL